MGVRVILLCLLPRPYLKRVQKQLTLVSNAGNLDWSWTMKITSMRRICSEVMNYTIAIVIRKPHQHFLSLYLPLHPKRTSRIPFIQISVHVPQAS
jgi:hypothetical protein